MYPNVTHQNHLTKRTDLLPVNTNAKPAQSSQLQRWVRAVRKNWKRRKMIAELHAMDNHLLKDIGIARYEINCLVDAFDDRELRIVPLAPIANLESAKSRIAA